MHPVHVGKVVRMSYSKQREVLEMPNLIEVQTDSSENQRRDAQGQGGLWH